MFSIASVFSVLKDIIDFVEDFLADLSGTQSAEPLTVQHVAASAATAINTAQTAVNLVENQVQLNAHQLGSINTALAAANAATVATVNTPTSSNLTLVLKALTDVVSFIPAGTLHDKVAAAVSAAVIVNAAFQQQQASAPVTISIPTPGAPGAAS